MWPRCIHRLFKVTKVAFHPIGPCKVWQSPCDGKQRLLQLLLLTTNVGIQVEMVLGPVFLFVFWP